MQRQRHTPEEIIQKLREAATLLAARQSVEEVCKKLEVSPPTSHPWRQKYGGPKEEMIKELKALEKVNTQPKKRVADLSLDKGCSRSCWRESGRPGAQTRGGGTS